MRRWQVQDPDGVYEFTEEQIMRDFYPFWCAEMQKAGKAEFISPEACLEDWIIVHWAEELPAT